jgi:hypothetical protein
LSGTRGLDRFRPRIRGALRGPQPYCRGMEPVYSRM